MYAPFDINWLATLVAAVPAFIVGALWYSPPLFGTRWMGYIGTTEEQIRASGSNTGKYVLAIVVPLVKAIALSVIADWAHADDLVSGALLGLIVGVAFVATSYLVTYAFESRPMGLLAINAGHDTVGLIAMGAVIGAWQ